MVVTSTQSEEFSVGTQNCYITTLYPVPTCLRDTYRGYMLGEPEYTLAVLSYIGN